MELIINSKHLLELGINSKHLLELAINNRRHLELVINSRCHLELDINSKGPLELDINNSLQICLMDSKVGWVIKWQIWQLRFRVHINQKAQAFKNEVNRTNQIYQCSKS